MAQSINLNIRGLHTYPSELSGVPEGSLAVADDVNISRPNIVEPRRGYNYFTDDTTHTVKALFNYGGELFAHYNGRINMYDTVSSWETNGAIGVRSYANTIKTAAMSNCLFITSDAGLQKIDVSDNATMYTAGVVKGLHMQNSTPTGSGTAIANDKSVAYRYLIARKDAQNNTVFGGVSGRLVVTTPAGVDTYDVPLKIYTPGSLDSTYFLQVYRTDAVDNSVTPDDEMQLCYERPLYDADTSGYSEEFTTDHTNDLYTVSGTYTFRTGSIVRVSTDGSLPSGLSANTDYYVIYVSDTTFKLASSYANAVAGTPVNITSNGTGPHTVYGIGRVEIIDITPDDLLGASLYTSPSQEGIVNDNTEPPLASDIAIYKDHMFFADVMSKFRYTVTLVGVGGTEGLALNDTITISDGATTEVLTAKSAESVANKEFDLETGLGSAALNIQATAASLVNIINQSSTLVYAYLLSTGDGDLPGKILLEGKTLGASSFTVAASESTCWSPQLQAVAGNDQTASADEFRNGLMWSKQGIPEAVPLKNIIRVGSSDDPIRRILPLRDGLFIFKERDGVFVLRGENEASFSVSLLDSTAKIVAYDSLAAVNNLIYGLFEAGICEISDSGASVVGNPIKDKILDLFGTCRDEVVAVSFGVGYDSEGKYLLALPESAGDTYCTQQYVYDVYNRTWCRWTLPVTCGFVELSGSLYWGSGTDTRIITERKNFDYSDYADYGGTATISSYSGTTVTLTRTDDMEVGDLLIQGDLSGFIESIDLNAGTVEVDLEQAWSAGSVTLLKGIHCKVEWNPTGVDNPAGLKNFSECSLLFKAGFTKEATMYFYSDVNPGESSIAVTSATGNGAFGEFTFGEEVFGGDPVKAPTRLGIPRSVARCNQISARFESRVAYSDFQLNGLSLVFTPTSTRVAR